MFAVLAWSTSGYLPPLRPHLSPRPTSVRTALSASASALPSQPGLVERLVNPIFYPWNKERLAEEEREALRREGM